MYGGEQQGHLKLYVLHYPTGECTSSGLQRATSDEEPLLSQSVHSLGVLVHCKPALAGLYAVNRSYDLLAEQLTVFVPP